MNEIKSLWNAFQGWYMQFEDGDKIAHAIVWCFACLLLSLCLFLYAEQTKAEGLAIIHAAGWTAIFAVATASAKEIFDWLTGKGTADGMDFVASVAGSLAGIVVGITLGIVI